MKLELFTKRNHIEVDNNIIYFHHWPDRGVFIVYKIFIGLGIIRYKFARNLFEGWQFRFFFIKVMV